MHGSEKARQQALHILQTFRTALEEGAAWLLEKETLLEDELPGAHTPRELEQ